jgi:hypothetical protein
VQDLLVLLLGDGLQQQQQQQVGTTQVDQAPPAASEVRYSPAELVPLQQSTTQGRMR